LAIPVDYLLVDCLLFTDVEAAPPVSTSMRRRLKKNPDFGGPGRK